MLGTVWSDAHGQAGKSCYTSTLSQTLAHNLFRPMQVFGGKEQLPCAGDGPEHCRCAGAQPLGEAASAACQPAEGTAVRHPNQPTQPHDGRQGQAGLAGGPSLAVQGLPSPSLPFPGAQPLPTLVLLSRLP